MDRYIDSVMLGSDRVDERARLIARLCDTVLPLVGDLGPRTPDLVRSALLGAMREEHHRPLDVVADVLDRLATAIGLGRPRNQVLSPGEALAVGVCDGRGCTDHALGAVIGIDRDEVAAARDVGRLAIGLPPAPPPCTRRHADDGQGATCVTCMLVRADAGTARRRVEEHGLVAEGLVVDRVVARARAWESEMLRPRLQHVADGPAPWTAIAAGMAV